MARRYDSRTTIFSPNGRLFQVEYAMEAISHAGSSVGILTSEGIVLAAEKKVTSKLLESGTKTEKLYKIDEHICCSVAGITADANILIEFTRLASQRYLYTYQEPVPIEYLVGLVCDRKQGYTQYGGLRPFGVSFLFAGYSTDHGFQLFQSDPSGNFAKWKATAIGGNTQSAQSTLKQDYNDTLSLNDALKLAVKVLAKTMDSTVLTAEKLEFATLTMKDKKPVYHVFTADEIEKLVKESDVKLTDEENA